MQNLMRERMMAMQIARARELFYWFGSFYALTLVAGVAAIMRGNHKPVIPLVPLTFVLGYQADLAYGNKIHRIRGK
jgi:hypothetical protein